MKKINLFLFFSYLPYFVLAQLEYPSFLLNETEGHLVVNEFDFRKYDSIVNSSVNGPLFFACPIIANIELKSASKLENSDLGTSYFFEIQSNAAKGLSLYFSKIEIPSDGYIKISSKTDENLFQIYDSKIVRNFNYLTSYIISDHIIIEYFEPTGNQNAEITLNRINHAFSNPNGGFGNSCPNQVDVRCSPERDDWRKEINSAVMLAVDGLGYCSATVVNNTNDDGKPLILTSEHCLNSFQNFKDEEGNQIFFSQADLAFNTEVWFNFESPWCNGPISVDHVFLKHTSIRSAWFDTDFLLLEINSQIPTSFNPYYSGWDRGDIAEQPVGGVGIHHPGGDVKKIATHSRVLGNSTCMTSIGWPSNSNFFRVAFWDATPNGHGKPEGASSGSGLFNAHNRLIGNLFGADCNVQRCTSRNELRLRNRTANAVNYGKLGVSWFGNGTPSGRLSNWLDPLNLNPMEYFGLRIIRDHYINYNKWVTGDIVKFFNVEVEAGKNVTVLELQDRFKANGTLKIPVGSTFKVYKP